jgi:hypothetical protein
LFVIYIINWFKLKIGLRDFTRGDIRGHQIDGILGNHNVVRGALVELGNGTGVFVLALNKELLGVFLNPDEGLFVQGGGPIVKEDRLIFYNGQFARVL